MKKLFTLALGAVALMSLSACGGYSTKVLERKDGKSYHLTGQFADWEVKADDSFKMTATSVAEVAKLDKNVGKLLSKRSLAYLYIRELNVTSDATWTTKALVNGEVKEFNGNHAVKVIRAEYNEEEETYTNDKWISDTDYKAYLESLSENLWVSPNYQKEEDENGFSWNYNPTITSEDGKYYIVVAEYTNESSEGHPGFGMAAIPVAVK